MFTFLIMLIALIIGGVICVLAIVFMFKQKTIFDANGNVTSIEIPIFGKMQTNAPAIVMVFLGSAVVILVTMNWDREPDYLNVNGKIFLDEEAIDRVTSVVVGVSNSSWQRTLTQNQDGLEIPFTLKVPDDWDTYTGYAFAHGDSGLRPAVIGVVPSKEFNLTLR